MAKKNRTNTAPSAPALEPSSGAEGQDTISPEAPGLDEAAVEQLLSRAAEADVEVLADQVAEVAEKVDALESDVHDLREAVDPTAPLDPAPEPAVTGSGTALGIGSIVPVTVNGQPATPEETRKAFAALARSQRFPAGQVHRRVY